MKTTRFKMGHHTFTHHCLVDTTASDPKLVVDHNTDELLCYHCGQKPVYNRVEIHIQGDPTKDVTINTGPGSSEMGLRERAQRGIDAVNEASARRAVKPFLKG